MHMRSRVAQLLIVLPIVACSTTRRAAEPASGRTPATVDAAGYSIYDVGGNWHSQTGAAVRLGDLRGTPSVIVMMYTRCSAACPIALANLKRIETEVPAVRFVLVSLDPERDTPGALSMFAREHELSRGRWLLLNGKDADVRSLAVVLGVRYRRLSADALAHSNALTLVDANGTIVRQELGFEGPTATIRVARTLGR